MMSSCAKLYSMEFPCVLLLVVSLLVKADFQVQIVDEGVNIYRNINASLTLNCTVTTDDKGPLDSISWEKDRKNINSTLSSNTWAVTTITHISPNDGGYYKCVAKHDGSKEEDGVFVNVEGKPVIFKSGESSLFTSSPQSLTNGDPATRLRCHATGSKSIKYQWFKQGKEIKPLDGFYFPATVNGQTLMISPVGKDKQGVYTCKATNDYGTDTHRIMIFVTDERKDPELTAESSMISSYVGQTSKVVCNGKNIMEHEASTEWHFNGNEITEEQFQNSSRLHPEKVFEESKKTLRMSLLINQTSLQDAGNYTCVLYVNTRSYDQTTLLVVKKRAGGPSGPGTSKMKEIVGLAVGLAILILLIIIGILIYFLTKRKRKMNYPEIPKGAFKFGAFITYNSQDFNWVEANLLPLLENNGIDVCIHFRNFEPGVAIHENMVNSIYMSRVVIVVMSNNYMKSKYCREELDYAVHRALEEHGTNPLIILRIDPGIKKSKLPKELKNKTFLDFTSNVEKDTWEKRLLKYVKVNDHENEDENENVREDAECVLLIKHGVEDDVIKDEIA